MKTKGFVIGFTGTRNGMTTKQKESFYKLIESVSVKEFLHGDCVGSDKEAHNLVHKLIKVAKDKIKIIGYPPKYNGYRAFCKCDVLLKPKDYLARNRNMVDDAEIMIATPPSDKEVLRSGTWSTIRYARKKDRLIYIIFPNGKIKTEGEEEI